MAPPPDRLGDTTSFLLIGLGKLLAERLEDAMAREKLSLRELGALGHVRSRPGISMSDLARRARVTPQSMHATVKALTRRGAITSGAGGQGRRASLSVTGEGDRLLREAAAAAAALDDAVFGPRSEELQRTALALIGSMRSINFKLDEK